MNTALYNVVNSVLTGETAPRVITFAVATRLFASVNPDATARSHTRWMAELVTAGLLQRVTTKIYLNKAATPWVGLSEAASAIRSGAIVSLQTVLGEFGVTNNFTNIVTAMVAFDSPSSGGIMPTLGGFDTEGGRFEFYGMPVDKLLAGKHEDRIISDRFYDCATPERAFLDWIYLGNSPRSKMPLPPLDCDTDSMHMPRVWRLAKAMKIEPELTRWLEAKAAYEQDENVAHNMSVRMGF